MPVLQFLSHTLLFLHLAMPGGAEQVSLHETVQRFWEALFQHDKVTAVEFVHPEDRNNFINRREGLFSHWKLERIEKDSERAAQVTVGIDKILPDGATLPVEVTEKWEKTEEGWKLRVAPLKSRVEALDAYLEERKRKAMPETLTVAPQRLRFYALAPSQPATVYIRNGLQIPVEVVEIVYDQSRFELLQRVTEVSARSVARIRFRFQGGEKGENLNSAVKLKIRVDRQIQEFQIPVTYNFQDGVTRWLKEQSSRKP